MVVSLVQYPQIKLEKSVNVTLSYFETECLINPTQKYFVGSQPYSFYLSFKETIIGDDSRLHKIQEVDIVNKRGYQVNPI